MAGAVFADARAAALLAKVSPVALAYTKGIVVGHGGAVAHLARVIVRVRNALAARIWRMTLRVAFWRHVAAILADTDAAIEWHFGAEAVLLATAFDVTGCDPHPSVRTVVALRDF
jgi:hypothetical protein